MPELAVDLEEMRAGFATLMLRKQAAPAQLGAAIGVDLPSKPGCTRAAGLTLIATGPETWLAVRDEPGPEWVREVQQTCRDIASVSDQTGGLAAWRLSGPDARALLQRGAFVDLHPHSFGPGDAATTAIAHIGVTIWQIEDSHSFGVAVFRSYAHSFRQWLQASI